MLLVKNWSIYNFILKKIIFRIGNEHNIDGKNNNVIEMQAIFVLNANYYSPGKRKFLDTNNLVISIPFKEATSNEKNCRLFEFMNLDKFADNPTLSVGMKRDIKLWHIIAHQPSIMYKGTLTYPDCEDTLWIVSTDYHYISSSDKNNLINATRYFYKTNGNNVRNLQNILPSTTIYRNFELVSEIAPKENKLHYNNSQFYKVSFVLLSLMLLILN